jgi:hypothetical protein
MLKLAEIGLTKPKLKYLDELSMTSLSNQLDLTARHSSRKRNPDNLFYHIRYRPAYFLHMTEVLQALVLGKDDTAMLASKTSEFQHFVESLQASYESELKTSETDPTEKYVEVIRVSSVDFAKSIKPLLGKMQNDKLRILMMQIRGSLDLFSDDKIAEYGMTQEQVDAVQELTLQLSKEGYKSTSPAEMIRLRTETNARIEKSILTDIQRQKWRKEAIVIEDEKLLARVRYVYYQRLSLKSR